ncbi:MAG: hypothetical protein H6702_15200 [Myxococcales bacterium]|nr:hypothetical protein [Myxococcales bacterium]
MRADFALDHGPGFDDHSDGEMWRYGVGEVQRQPDVPSHLALDRDSGLLFIADTGNGRVATLDTTVGGDEATRVRQVMEPGTRLWLVEDHAPIETFGTTADDLERPSGLALGPDGNVYVGDNATGRIWAYSRDGVALDWLDTGLPAGGLMGLTFHPDTGDLYYVDAVGDQVLRVRAR